MNKKNKDIRLSPHRDCQKCDENLKIIQNDRSDITRRSTAAMLRLNERIAVCGIVGQKTMFRIIPLEDVSKILQWNEQTEERYQEAIKELKPGEIVIIMAHREIPHIGIYKLPGERLN